MKTKFFSSIVIVALTTGCGTTQAVKTSIVNFNGTFGIINVQNAPWGREEIIATFNANTYCLNLSNGYGVKGINSVGGGNFNFSCVIKTKEESTAIPKQYIINSENKSTVKDPKIQCLDFGFPEGSSGLAGCVLQLELAKKQSAESESRFKAEQAAYERQQSAIEKERDRRRGAALFELGTRMMGGQSPINALGSMGAGSPIAPIRPNPISQNIILPNGRMINCTTTGAMTNCF